MASVSCFAPHVQKHLEEIIKHGKIGMCPGTIKILNPMPSSPAYAKNAKCDRFKMAIPYGGHSVTWEVLFQSSHPDCPPDFIFADYSFLPELEDVTTLCNWDCKRHDGLLKAVKELLELYRRQQVSLLENYSRVHFEYSTLTQQTSIQDGDIEVFVSPNKEGPISFLIKLDVDFSGIPPVLTQDNPGEDTALLLVTFHNPEGNKITPKLFLSPRVEHALGGSQSWRIPAFSSEGCLMDYVPFVQDALLKKVDIVAHSYEKRKEFIAVFLSHFDNCVVEYDIELFSKLILLLEQNDFYFLFQVDLPMSFPNEKPPFTFRSVYHTCLGKPFYITINNYPYSPSWTIHKMLEKTLSFIQDYIPEFQRNSIRN